MVLLSLKVSNNFINLKNYTIFQEYNKVIIFFYLTWMIDSTMNLITGLVKKKKIRTHYYVNRGRTTLLYFQNIV